MARARSAARASAKGASASGRAAIVTGGASGIGLACVEALLAAGWKVGILERDEKALDRARERFRGERAVRIGQLDVTDEPAAIAAVNGMAAAFGRLDGVLNSAGIGADVHVLDTPVDLFRKILDINVTGTFIVARAAARIMKDQGGGATFMVVSIVAFVVLGSVLEGIPAIVLFGPLLFPIARQVGINEVHYAMVVVLAMGIGLFAPPFGVGYYAACAIGRVNPDEGVRPIWGYLAALLVGLAVVAAVPWLSTGFLDK